MHSSAFTRQGGTFEAIQLWVNLPAQYKMEEPHYQAIVKEQIPAVMLDEKGSVIRVIAGIYKDLKGPANTYTPIDLWDLRLSAGQDLVLDLPENYTTILLALHGRVEINRAATLNDAEVAFFKREGNNIMLNAVTDSTLLLMSGEPIAEPIAGYGPFVMNTQEEISQAIADFSYR
jgi:redox-sensitive bicupin YhaK (pirin superfamily)